jgi:hypothetical protein
MIEDSKQDPLSIFVYVLRAPETKRQYPKRLEVVLEFLGFEGSLAVKAA